MSDLHIVFGGEQSPGKVTVFGKKRVVVPFIGIIEREYGKHERGVGVKCPTQEKMIFHPLDSDDPLHYLRAFKLLCEVGELNDSIVQDCIIATKDQRRFENLAKTSVYLKNGENRISRFFDAQRRAMEFNPSPEDIKHVVDGFAQYLAPLTTKEAVVQTEEGAESLRITADQEQLGASIVEDKRGCYKPLLTGFALESSVRHAMPSAV